MFVHKVLLVSEHEVIIILFFLHWLKQINTMYEMFQVLKYCSTSMQEVHIYNIMINIIYKLRKYSMPESQQLNEMR